MFNLEINKPYQILILFEDKYDLNWFYYHKTEGKKVKCGKHLDTPCHFCEKGDKLLFVSFLPIYIRDNQINHLLYLRKNEYEDLVNLFNNLVKENILTADLKNIKNHFFSLQKSQYGKLTISYLRENPYKKMEIKFDFNLNQYIKNNFVSYDCFGRYDGDIAMRKIRLQRENEE